MVLWMKLVVDVRGREEYVQQHIKGSINIPLFDLEYYVDFLRDKTVFVYCNTGHRSKMAADFLGGKGIRAEVIPPPEVEGYEKEGRTMVCAINYLAVKPGLEEEFEQKTRELCQVTYGMKGFLGSNVFRVSTISYGGSGLQGEYTDMKVKPTEYVMLTYWESKEVHEEFHKQPVIMEGFMGLMKYLAVMPREVYGEVIR